MKKRFVSIIVICSIILAIFASVSIVKAEDPFHSPDEDMDGLANDLEITGWYNLSGGPFITDPRDRDSDDDGLTDGEEKLFDTNPLDSHSPGLSVRYETSYMTKQYFNTTDPAYLSIRQGGDRYLMTEAVVLRRGTTFYFTGPANGTLSLAGTSMTSITPTKDPARGGWSVTLPITGTVGTYIATITDSDWTETIPVYVIFELPTDMPSNEVAAFLYDDDPANKKDEVAVFWSMQEWKNWFTCPQPNNGICSNDAYHVATGYAQAFWTEQFTKSAFVDHAIKAIHGKTSQALAAPSIGSWEDTEFRTRSGKVKNSWTASMNRWYDGTGITMDGGYCETTSTVLTTLFRSAGIAARPYTLDYNKTAGHSESGQIGTIYEYDHSTMMWIDGTWKAMRGYSGEESSDLYYPWNHGTTSVAALKDARNSSLNNYYNDTNGDVVVSVNAGWDFQNGNNGGGVVNTIWPMDSSQRLTVNQDYYWKSNWPLQITQSPYVDILSCEFMTGDNWAPGEWRNPSVSNPAGLTALQSYNLPSGIPDSAVPLENVPYNPRPTACSASTPTEVCNAFKASWNTNTCTVVSGPDQVLGSYQSLNINQATGGTISANPKPAYKLGQVVTLTANAASGYTFTGWTGDASGTLSPTTITIDGTRKIVSAIFSPSGTSSNTATVENNGIEGDTTNQFENREGRDDLTPSLVGPEISVLKKDPILFGKILRDYGLDTDQDMKFDQLVIEVEVTSSLAGEYKLGGQLLAGENPFRADSTLTLKVGKQIVLVSFDGLNIGDSQVNGPYIVEALWIAALDESILPLVLSENMLTVKEFGYSTNSYKTGEFEVTAALFANSFSHLGIDKNNNGLFEAITIDVSLNIAIPGTFLVKGDLYDSQGNYVSQASWTGNNNEASLRFEVAKFQPPFTVANLQLISNDGQILDSRTYQAYEITDMEDKIEAGAVSFAHGDQLSKPEPGVIAPLSVNPSGTYAVVPVDTNGNGLYDKLRINLGVTVTNTGGNYRVEGLLEDEFATQVAWSVSDPQSLVVGNRTMSLDFDGKMIYDQLPLSGSRSLKFVAVKIFSGNLSALTLESEAPFALITPAYTRSQFEPSSSTIILFQDDLENSIDKWMLSGTMWGLDDNTWQSGSHSWKASATSIENGQMTIASPLNFSDYADPVLRFNHAYRLGSVDDKGTLQVSTNEGLTWTTIATFDGIATTPHWVTEEVDLSAYSEQANVQLRFNAIQASATGLLWYLDDIYVNASPAIKTASFTIPGLVEEGKPATFVASYTSIDTTLPVTYTWNFGDQEFVTDSPTYQLVFQNSGEIPVMLTVANPYDSAIITQTVTVVANSENYVLSTIVTPDVGGMVVRSPNQQSFIPGTPVTLTAIPAAGYNFSNWSGGGCSGSNPCNVTMNADKNVTANFVRSTYTLTVNIPGGGGTISTTPTGPYQHGDMVQLTAIPNNGYAFSSWSRDITGSTNPASVIIDGNKTITAAFVPGYSLTVTTVGSGSVTKWPDQAYYLPGTVVTLTPTSSSGWTFSNWSGACTGSGSCAIAMNSNKSVTSTFVSEPYTLTVVVLTAGGHTVSKDPDLATYSYGQTVTLTATPLLGYRLSAWSRDLTGSVNPAVITIDGNKAVFATFSNSWPFTTSVSPLGKGTITKSPNRTNYTYGAQVTLTANPISGWRFDHWDGSCTGSGACVVTVDGNEEVTAYFTQTTYILTVTQPIGGTITPATATYNYGTVVELTATPDTDYHFVGWTGACTGSGSCSVTVDGDKTVSATFAMDNTYILTVTQTPGGTITPPTTTYNSGTIVFLTATPNPGFHFVEWVGECTGAGVCNVTMDADKSVSAVFAIGAYSLDIIVNGSGIVTKNPDQPSYADGAIVTLTPTPSNGWSFSSWGGACTGNGPCVVVMDSNKSISATFTQNEYTLTVTIVGQGNVYHDINGPYHFGDSVHLTAAPSSGWTFDSWSGDLTGDSDQTVINIDGNKNVTATFTEDWYTLTVILDGNGHVDVIPPGPYRFHAMPVLTAYPDPGWTFVNWTGERIGTANPIEVTINNDSIEQAHFTATTCYVLTINHHGSGTNPVVDPANSNGCPVGQYGAGQIINLSGAAPDTGWQINSWEGTTNNNSTASTNTLTMPAGAHSAAVNYTQNEYTLTIVSDHGMVTKSPALDTYHYGDVVTLSIVADSGWMFTGWTPALIDNKVTISENTTVTANFTPILQNCNALTISHTGNGANPIAAPANSTDCTSEQYTPGEAITLSGAAPDTGWQISSWVGTTNNSSTASTNTLIMPVGAHSTAVNYTQNEYTLEVVSDHGVVTKSPAQDTYHYGDVVTLSVVAENGWTFTGWAPALTDNKVTITNNTTITAIYTQNEYTLTVVSDHGVVTKSPAQNTYHYGDIVTLSVVTDSGWTFTGWSGSECSGNGLCVVNIVADMSVTAIFSQVEYGLSVGIDPASSNNTLNLSNPGPIYYLNDVVTLTAVAAEDWRFDHWKIGDTVITENPTNVTITGNIVVTAYFNRIEYTLTVIQPTGGTISPQTGTFDSGTVVELTATPASGFHFVEWTGDCTGSNGCSVTMDADKSVSATFELNRYLLTVNQPIGGTISPQTGFYDSGTVVELIATPASGFHFVEWTGACTGSGACSVIMDVDKSVSATFELNKYLLTVNQSIGGTISPQTALYDLGTVVELTTTPAQGYHFFEWTGACTGSGPCIVTMDGNKSVGATFMLDTYTLTVTQSTGGSITPATASYDYGTHVILTATGDPGWYFDHWSGGGCSNANPCTVIMTADVSITATFTQGLFLPKNLIDVDGTVVQDFESLTGWKISGYSIGYSMTLDSEHVKQGSASIKMTVPSSSEVVIGKSGTWDLSANQGNLRLWVFMADTGEPVSGSIKLSSDRTETNYFVVYYGGAFKLRYKPGWNLINLRTSDWKAIGSPTWSNIQLMRIRIYSSTANSFSFDELTSGVVARPAVIFAFDNGLASLYSQAYAYMQPRNVRGSAYIPTNLVGTSGKSSWVQLLEMYNGGWTIGNYTMTGNNLAGLTQAEQESQLMGSRTALYDHGINNSDYVAYPGGSYDNNTLAAMSSLAMRSGRTRLSFNNVSPLTTPYEIAQRSITLSTSITTAMNWVITAISRQEIIVITFQDITPTPTANDWYTSRFKSLVDYCISQGIPIITMDDLYRLQSGSINIPVPIIP